MAPSAPSSPIRRLARLRGVLAVTVVLAGSLFGGLLAVWSWSAERDLSVATVSLSVSPFHDGALDLYVPLVDWGVRFGGVRLPARLKVEVQAVDRRAAADIASRGLPAVEPLRARARDAIASYLKALAGLAAGAALALGALVALAARGVGPMRARWLAIPCVAGAAAWVAAVAFLLAPRGDLAHPTYYAHGSDIPVALRAVESATRTPGALSETIDSQLVGLAHLVIDPGRRPSLAGRPRLVVASDLHNNVLTIPAIRSAAAGAPVLFPGDLADRGTPLEASLVTSVVHTGHPFVFSAGNHDSDTLSRDLARHGAIVLTRRGRLLPDGRHGPLIVHVGGLRIAGYDSPNERLSHEGYRDRGATITPLEQAAFATWLRPLLGRVDVVLVHEPQLLTGGLLDELRASPRTPLLFAVGHTHHLALDSANGVTVLNGGTIGAGGTGNLADANQKASLAVLTYSRDPFEPLAADLVTIDPGTGGATAQRVRLDEGDVHVGRIDAASPELSDKAADARAAKTATDTVPTVSTTATQP